MIAIGIFRYKSTGKLYNIINIAHCPANPYKKFVICKQMEMIRYSEKSDLIFPKDTLWIIKYEHFIKLRKSGVLVRLD